MKSRVCVYCLATKDVTAFNVEHVLPQAFGRFEQNLTLNSVCHECNQYFGDNLELYFTRDGIEGLQRLQYGMKPATGVKELRRTRIQSIVLGESPQAGMHLDFVAEDGELRVTPLTQVGLLVEGRWRYVTEEQLQDATRALPAPVTRIKLLANSPEGYERLTALLAARGIPFRQESISPPLGNEGDWAALDIRTTIDGPVLRCIAKIAFNYMVWVAGLEFALRDELNPVRAFIRHGTPAPYRLVVPTSHPVLADELPNRRQTEGHLLTVFWSRLGPHLVGQVCLFTRSTTESGWYTSSASRCRQSGADITSTGTRS
jgi:hypothetical protein